MKSKAILIPSLAAYTKTAADTKPDADNQAKSDNGKGNNVEAVEELERFDSIDINSIIFVVTTLSGRGPENKRAPNKPDDGSEDINR